MPVYGVEAYIARAIESVQHQTFKDWELLIVNDGTKDRSREIASKYEQNDSRIHIIDKPNGGLTSARLKGLEYAQGDYLSFIDSDDSLQPEYLEVLYINIQNHDADISMCSYNLVKGSNTMPQSLYFGSPLTIIERGDIFEAYFLPQITSILKDRTFLPSFLWLRLFRKDVVSKELFVSERIVYQEDLAFSARIIKRLKRVVVINKPMYNYFVNSGSLTQKYRENAWEMMKLLTEEIKLSYEGQSKTLIEEMINNRSLCAVHFILMNAARGNYKQFKNEFTKVLKDNLVIMACKRISIFNIKRAYIALVISIRLRLPLLIYKYNKKRV